MTDRPHRKTAPERQESCAFVALGANLPSPWGPPRATLEAALVRLQDTEIRLVRQSSWYETAPVPDLDQPWYVNAVVELATTLDPGALLARLHQIEAAFGRVRRERWEARAIDLDLIDQDGIVSAGPEPILPHPRMAERAFVLIPLAEVAPAWRHPVNGRPIAGLIAALPPGQRMRKLADSPSAAR